MTMSMPMAIDMTTCMAAMSTTASGSMTSLTQRAMDADNLAVAPPHKIKVEFYGESG